jgi:hypothetical protein
MLECWRKDMDKGILLWVHTWHRFCRAVPEQTLISHLSDISNVELAKHKRRLDQDFFS